MIYETPLYYAQLTPSRGDFTGFSFPYCRGEYPACSTIHFVLATRSVDLQLHMSTGMIITYPLIVPPRVHTLRTVL
jgi:hypothetical protein